MNVLKQIIEGAELLTEPPHSIASSFRAPVIELDHGLILDDRTLQAPTCFIGGVGSGKTTLMERFIDPIAAQAETAGDTMVFFCAKPDFIRRYARPGDPIISVTNLEPDSCPNLFRELECASNPELTLRELAITLFSEQKSPLQPFFANAAQDIFIQACLWLFDRRHELEHFPDNKDLIELLQSTPDRFYELADQYPAYFSMIPVYLGESNQTGLAILSELRLLISSTFHSNFAAHGNFSMIRALRENRRIFLHYDYAHASQSSLKLIKFLLELAMKEGMSPDRQSKTWFLLDEASLLPHSEVLFDALSLGRDPGGSGNGGLRFLFAIQSAKLLANHYSPEEAQILLSLFPNLIILRTMDPDSRRAMADRYGEARYHYAYSLGGKVNYVDAREPVISDAQFSAITEPGNAICSMPTISPNPFLYHGHRKE